MTHPINNSRYLTESEPSEIDYPEEEELGCADCAVDQPHEHDGVWYAVISRSGSLRDFEYENAEPPDYNSHYPAYHVETAAAVTLAGFNPDGPVIQPSYDNFSHPSRAVWCLKLARPGT